MRQVLFFLMCCHASGVYRSADWGKRWELLRLNAGDTVPDMAVSGNRIYTGTVRR